MHWVDVIAKELLEQKSHHVIASGTSISGEIHIGNAGDVIMADSIRRSIEEHGGTARLLWIADDFDPLRKVPKQMPPEFSKYLGMPVSSLPDVDGCHKSFVEHHVDIFVNSLGMLGVRPIIRSGAELYQSGKYDELTRTAIEKASEIINIFKEVSGSERPQDWIPFDPICQNCGKIATTHAYGYENDKILYKCRGGVAGKQKIEGCGHEGSAEPRNGKLAWRVEVAARWKMMGITCEPFGKEHTAAGGTCDTATVITKRIFNYEPPKIVHYEHILVGGQKMSKSLGNIITLEDMLAVAPPEITRFFFFRTKATKHKDFDITTNLIQLIEDYEHIERLYYGVDKPSPQEDAEELKRTYELSQLAKAESKFFQVPYRHLISTVQIKNNWEELIKTLARTEHLAKLDDNTEIKLKQKIDNVRKWLERLAPESEKFKIQETLEISTISALTNEQKAAISELVNVFENIEWTPENIHKSIYNTSEKLQVQPKAIFQAIYLLFLSKQIGPRIGYFLGSLDRDFVVERLKAASA